MARKISCCLVDCWLCCCLTAGRGWTHYANANAHYASANAQYGGPCLVVVGYKAVCTSMRAILSPSVRTDPGYVREVR